MLETLLEYIQELKPFLLGLFLRGFFQIFFRNSFVDLLELFRGFFFWRIPSDIHYFLIFKDIPPVETPEVFLVIPSETLVGICPKILATMPARVTPQMFTRTPLGMYPEIVRGISNKSSKHYSVDLSRNLSWDIDKDFFRISFYPNFSNSCSDSSRNCTGD